MGMTIYTAHIYVKSEKDTAYFELGFENEAEPELVVKDSFMREFSVPKERKKLMSDAFDSNLLWEDEDPHTLLDEINDQAWDNESVSEDFDAFCNKVADMDDIEYVMFTVDSDQENWRDNRTYWYDAKVYDYRKGRLLMIEWRGSEVQDPEYQDPFNEETAKDIIQLLFEDKEDQIDIGDFARYGKPAGRIKEKTIESSTLPENQDVRKKKTVEGTCDKVSDDLSKQTQAERALSLMVHLDNIEFEGKNFVLAGDYTINANPDGIYEYDISLSPSGFIGEKGGVVKKSVSGKTDFLIVDPYDDFNMNGAKVRDALAQIEKGKPIKIISLFNLKEILQI